MEDMENKQSICPKCGTENNQNDKFCSNCGKKLATTKRNILLKSFIILVILALSIWLIAYYICIQKSKEIDEAPYSTSWTFSDTKTYVNTKYNTKYDVIIIDLDIDQKIEQWQIDALNSNTTDIKITCQTYDGLQKKFNFEDVRLNVGEKLKGKYIIEHATLKDFLMIKELLQGDATISFSKIISMDSKEREKQKQSYNRKNSWGWY